MKIIILISFVVLTGACNYKNDNQSAIQSSDSVSTDTVVKEIPEWMKDSLFQEASLKLEQHLDLPSIQNGFNEFQIRIWIGYKKHDTLKTIILKRIESHWVAEFYYYVIYKNKAGEFVGINKRVELKHPKSGWDLFIDSLFATGIQNLKDAGNIKGYSSATHSNAISVEIASAKKYRIYQYPDFFSNLKFSDPARLQEALAIVQREFEIEVL
jgi:hypothetical protein